MRTVKIIAASFTVMVGCALLFVWWTDRLPKRPPNLSTNALYIERGEVPFKLSNTGDWLDCWFDERARVDRCKLTNMNGWIEFEDVFLPLEGQGPVLQSDLALDRRRTGTLWGGTKEKDTLYPIVYLKNGEILIPRSEYEKAKRLAQGLR